MIRAVAGAYRSAFRGLPREVWLIATVLLVNRAGTMVLPFLSLYLTREREMGVAAAGRLLALYGVGAAVGSYLGGRLSDRIGARATQLLSLLSSGAAYAVLAELRGTAAIAVAIFVLSVLAESFRPAAMTAMAERAPRELQVRSFALLRLAANVGMALGPALGGWLALRGYRWLFLADGATCWAAAAILARTLGPDAGPAAGGGRRRRRGGASPWRDRSFLLLLVLVFFVAVALFQVFGTLPLYLREAYGLREGAIGALLAFNAGLIVVFEMVLVHGAERWKRSGVIGLGSCLVCAGLGLMPLGASVAFAALTIAVWTVGEMLALPMLNAAVADRAAPGSRGRYMGAYTTAFSVAFVVAPGAGTWVYEHLGPETLWYAIGAAGPALWVASHRIRRALDRDRPGGPPPSAPSTASAESRPPARG